MMISTLALTEEAGPSYASNEICSMRENDLALVIDVVVLDTEVTKCDKYYRLLCPSGIGWINSSYVEEID